MFRSPTTALIISTLVLCSCPALGQDSGRTEGLVPMSRADGVYAPEIVNGLTTSGFPSVVELIDTETGTEICTGTFIGCETVLTAASCVCSSVGSDCQAGGPDLLDPAVVSVFAQHAGFYTVASISVPVEYELGVAADVAILKLATPVTGIAPSPINTVMRPAVGTAGEIVGFGETQGDENDNGVKRHGQVVTSVCTQVPGDTHVCWLFEDPLADPGSDSGSCSGDSGGPLLVDLGTGPVVAGVTSGGFNPTCLPDLEAFDADVYVYRSWIQTIGGSDLLNRSCGNLAQAGTSGAPFVFGEGVLSSFDRHHTWVTPVPPATATLRAAINGEDGVGNDFDLYIRYGAPPTIQEWDCGSSHEGTPEICEFPLPTSGLWYFLADWVAGSGLYQLTVTSLGPEDLIFSDGFESSSTSAWSDTEPP